MSKSNDKKTNDINDMAKNQNRRTTLKTLLAGGGVLSLAALPNRWAKPVVDSVILPAHAQTSPGGANGFSVDIEADASDWLNWLMPKAYAGRRIPSGFLCIGETGSESFEASYDAEGIITTGGGKYGDCVTLQCGKFEVDLVVGGRNGDGSFDFQLYEPGAGCSEKASIITERTNVPCNIASKDCRKEGMKEMEENGSS